MAIEKIQCDNRKNYNSKRKKANAYEVSDLVAIKRTQVAPGSKFRAKFYGPYEITRILRDDRYVVTKIGEQEGPRTTTTSADHIKRWISVHDLRDFSGKSCDESDEEDSLDDTLEANE